MSYIFYIIAGLLLLIFLVLLSIESRMNRFFGYQEQLMAKMDKALDQYEQEKGKANDDRT